MQMILQGSYYQLQWMQGLSAICPSVLEPISFEISQWLQASCLRSCMWRKQFGKLMVFLLNRDGWAPRLVTFSSAWWQMHCFSFDKQVIATNIDYGKWECGTSVALMAQLLLENDSSPALHILVPYDFGIRHASNLEPTLIGDLSCLDCIFAKTQNQLAELPTKSNALYISEDRWTA